MLTQDLQSITAVAEAGAYGQTITKAVLEYRTDVTTQELQRADFHVKDRRITGVYTAGAAAGETAEQGRFAILELDGADRAACTFEVKQDGRFGKFTVKELILEVSQRADISAADGTLLPAFEGIKSTQTDEGIVERFIKRTYRIPGSERILRYNLYIPKDIRADEVYPLVLFLHDASTCSAEQRAPLIQGNGALVWAQDAEKGTRPCFVLAPAYPEVCANDDFVLTWEADATVELLKSLCMEYMNIDRGRLYATGQSMGCMMISDLLLRNPGFFAGALLVDGQWNPETMGKAKDENIWAVVSQRDSKAFPIMGACFDAMEAAGGTVRRQGFDAGQSQDAVSEKMRAVQSPDCHLYFTYAEGESILPGELKAEDPGCYHVYTWKYAYGLEALREWLFKQRTEPFQVYDPVTFIDFSSKRDILLESEDGTLTPMDEPYFRPVKIAEGTWQILSDGDFSYLLEGDNEALLIDSG